MVVLYSGRILSYANIAYKVIFESPEAGGVLITKLMAAISASYNA